MERFDLIVTLAENEIEIQFDHKKLPGERGPSYMLSVGGVFKGYITKDRTGQFVKLINANLTAEEMKNLNDRLLDHISINKFHP